VVNGVVTSFAVQKENLPWYLVSVLNKRDADFLFVTIWPKSLGIQCSGCYNSYDYYYFILFVLPIIADWLMTLMTSSNLGRHTDYHDVLCGIPQSLQANDGIVF
jgi:hypothetical protein